MYEVERNEDGSIKRSIRNLANMNMLQYIVYVLVPNVLRAAKEMTFEIAPLLFGLLYALFVIITFPVSLPILAWHNQRQARKDLVRLTGNKA